MADHPKRIQRQRTKGWRMPEGAVYVGRGSPDGNRYQIIREGRRWAVWKSGTFDLHQCRNEADAHDLAVSLYRADIEQSIAADPQAADLMRARLRGKCLACWCKPELRCHADVLLEIANA